MCFFFGRRYLRGFLRVQGVLVAFQGFQIDEEGFKGSSDKTQKILRGFRGIQGISSAS